MLPIQILLVEDTFEHQQIFSEVLIDGRPQVRVDVAYSGEEFLALAKDAGIDCFIVDFNLPDGSAAELIAKAAGHIGDRPVIVISASDDQRIAIESFRHGGCDFVPKDQAIIGDCLWQRVESAIARWKQKCEGQRKSQQSMEELLRQGETDALTGLLNRRYFMGMLGKNSAIRSRTNALGCIMLDLDNFKRLNDTYGHGAGDRVLKAVARVIKPTDGSTDTVMRWGGEEFVILHNAPTLSDCVLWAEVLRLRIASLRVNHKHQPIAVTASFGVVHRTAPRLGLEIIDLADQALYLAKKQGRNCVCTYNTVCVERRLSECELLSQQGPTERRQRFLDSCTRTLGPNQLQHLTDHCEQVSRMAAELAAALHLSDEEVRQVRDAGLFHDIGKSVVPESLIGKPEALSEAESILMRRHIEASERIATRLGLDAAAARLVRMHHERFDTARISDIPLGARILAAADAMAAMLSDRAYRHACTYEEMKREMLRNRGTQFDPQVVDAALSRADQWRAAA